METILRFFSPKKPPPPTIVLDGNPTNAFGRFLPVEVGILILSFLSPFKIPNFCVVNRSWNTLINSPLLWRLFLTSMDNTLQLTDSVDKKYFEKKFAELDSEFVKSPTKVCFCKYITSGTSSLPDFCPRTKSLIHLNTLHHFCDNVLMTKPPSRNISLPKGEMLH